MCNSKSGKIEEARKSELFRQLIFFSRVNRGTWLSRTHGIVFLFTDPRKLCKIERITDLWKKSRCNIHSDMVDDEGKTFAYEDQAIVDVKKRMIPKSHHVCF